MSEVPGAYATPTPPLPQVRVGSHTDAKRLRATIQGLLAGINRAGDRLAMLLDLARTRAIHLMLEDPHGRPFPSWEAFVTHPQPCGLGYSVAVIEALLAERRDAVAIARAAQPLMRWGHHRPKPAPAPQPVASAPPAPPAPAPASPRSGNGARYLAGRLARDHLDGAGVRALTGYLTDPRSLPPARGGRSARAPRTP